MANRELNMYKLKDAVEALLADTPIKRIARLQKISKNTVKKYRKIIESILAINPEIHNNIEEIMTRFSAIRGEERYSENFGWLETNKELVNHLTGQCDNYIVLIQKLNPQLPLLKKSAVSSIRVHPPVLPAPSNVEGS